MTWTRSPRQSWFSMHSIRVRLSAILFLIATAIAVAACSRDVVQVTIPVGSNFRQATDSLKRAKLISFAGLFRTYAKLTRRDRALKAGTYLIARGSSWSTILDTLTRGRGVSHTLTVPEGLRLATIESLLVRKLSIPEDSVSRATRDETLRQQYNIPTGTLEGYLYPDTYSLPLGAPASVAIRTMMDRFARAWDTTWNARLEELGMTRHEIMTLASIVEKEAIVPSERPVISAVFHNRLRIRMPLQADPTVQYARNQHNERVLLKDLEVKSPYNTYRNAGLPPGPIASPGVESIKAALYPASVKFLYFVAHPDGHHEFRNTYSEHLQAKQLVERIRKQSAAQRADSSR